MTLPLATRTEAFSASARGVVENTVVFIFDAFVGTIHVVFPIDAVAFVADEVALPLAGRTDAFSAIAEGAGGNTVLVISDALVGIRHVVPAIDAFALVPGVITLPLAVRTGASSAIASGRRMRAALVYVKNTLVITLREVYTSVSACAVAVNQITLITAA